MSFAGMMDNVFRSISDGSQSGIAKIFANNDVYKQKGLFAAVSEPFKPGPAMQMGKAETLAGLQKKTKALSEQIADHKKSLSQFADDPEGLKNVEAKISALKGQRKALKKQYSALDNASDTAVTRKGAAAYLTGADVEKNRHLVAAGRVGATGLGLHVAGSLTRGMTGGDSKYNARGERDLAGIPFI